MSRNKSFSKWRKEYMVMLNKRELSKEYVVRVDQVLKKVFTILKNEDGKRGSKYTEPDKLTFDDVLYIRNTIGIGPSGSTRKAKYYVDIFRAFLRFSENYQPSPKFKQYIPYRPRVESHDYAKIWVKLNDYTGDDWDIITGRVIVQLASLTCRRIGLLRLEPKNINENSFVVVDKGPFGGKPREIPFDDITKSLVKDYLDRRKKVIDQCLEKIPIQPIPQKVFIWYRNDGRMGSVSGSKFDKVMQRISGYSGETVTCHRLRRLGCTELWTLTKNPAVCCQISGHEEFSTFMKYLGLNPDVKVAINQLAEYRQKVILELAQRAEVETQLGEKVNGINKIEGDI